MLFYASLIGGISALFLGFAALLLLVSVYVIFVWPLTFWDLANLGLEELGSWIWVIVTATFAGGALGGYTYFSGFTFKSKPKPKIPARPLRMAR